MELESIRATRIPTSAGRGETSDKLRKARGYRQRAEELRTIAQDWIDDEAQSTLFRIARDYDRMANSLERSGTPERSVTNASEL